VGHCADDADLAEVEVLLAAHDRLTDAVSSGDDDLEADPRPGPGAIVGAYRLIERIGEGGMGEVYRAARADGAFDRDVAIEITRAALTGRDAHER
jgi:serine/threonine protein kinase